MKEKKSIKTYEELPETITPLDYADGDFFNVKSFQKTNE